MCNIANPGAIKDQILISLLYYKVYNYQTISRPKQLSIFTTTFLVCNIYTIITVAIKDTEMNMKIHPTQH